MKVQEMLEGHQDWPAKRRCLHSDAMLAVLKEARTFFFALERGDYNVYDNVRKQAFIEDLQIVIELADGLSAPATPQFPVPPGFPKPPTIG